MNISASALPLLVSCSAPAHHLTVLERDKPNDGMRFGNAVHRLAEWYVVPGEQPTVEGVAEMEGVPASEVPRLATVFGALRDWIDFFLRERDSYESEVAIAYCPETGEARVLGRGIGRDYKAHGLRDDEIAGTADLVLQTEKCVTVVDYKTGKGAPESYRWQLRELGLAAARAYGKPAARVLVAKVNEVEVDDGWQEVLEADDIEDVAGEVLRIYREASAPAPVSRAGEWCDANYCRARKKCDAYRSRKAGVT